MSEREERVSDVDTWEKACQVKKLYRRRSLAGWSPLCYVVGKGGWWEMHSEESRKLGHIAPNGLWRGLCYFLLDEKPLVILHKGIWQVNLCFKIISLVIIWKIDQDSKGRRRGPIRKLLTVIRQKVMVTRDQRGSSWDNEILGIFNVLAASVDEMDME